MMTKRLPAAIAAAILTICVTGCSFSGVRPGTDIDPPPESFITESAFGLDNSDESGIDDTSFMPDVPADTESVAEVRGVVGLPIFDEGSDEDKVYNIFCGDTAFMELVARYCDFEELPGGGDADVGEEKEAGLYANVSGEDSLALAQADSGEESPVSAQADSGDEPAESGNCTVVCGKIGDARVRFILCHETGEAYLKSLDLSLIAGPDPDEVTDLYLVDSADVQKYLDRDVRAALALHGEVGIRSRDLRAQYDCTRILGSGSDHVQRAVSYEVSPGVFMYSRKAAMDVLGSDDPSIVGEQLADWNKFDAVAAKAAEKGYAMLRDWNDSFDVFAAGIGGDWLTETGGVKIDDALLAWSDQTGRYIKEGYYADSDDSRIFGTFIAAKELMDLIRDTDMTAENFKAEYAVCEGPSGWARGGSYLVVNADCDQRVLSKKILETIVFDKDVLAQMKAEGFIPNHRTVLPQETGPEPTDRPEAAPADGPEAVPTEVPEAAQADGPEAVPTEVPNAAASAAKFLGGQDPYPVFAEAAKRFEPHHASVYDQYLCGVYRRELASYYAGEKDFDTAMKVFYREVTSLISEEE